MTSRTFLAVFLMILIGSALVGTASAAESTDDSRIQAYPKNPYYWQFHGRPVLLLGGSVDDNLFQIRQLKQHLDLLQSAGGNYVRNTMSCRDEGNVWPFAKDGSRYDLDRFNDRFWQRFETFLAETAKREIIVQIEVWATFDYYRDIWDRNPFNPKNNINYTAEQSGLPLRVNSHPTRTENDFFRAPPGAKDLAVVRKYQERFVGKILLHSLKYDHVLYCMDNETSVTPKWGAYWATFIRKRAALVGRHVETTEMWDSWDLANPMHNATFDHPEIYSFVDISQNNHQKGQTHYDNALKQRRRVGKQPRPLSNVKIYGEDGGRFGDRRDGIERFWRNVFAGLASARFHRPDSGIGLSPASQRMIRGARDVTNSLDLPACEPHNDLLSDREENEAYCLAELGKQAAVYFPRGGQVKLNLSIPGDATAMHWYDIDRGRWLPAKTLGKVSGRLTLKAPGGGQWAVVIK